MLRVSAQTTVRDLAMQEAPSRSEHEAVVASITRRIGNLGEGINPMLLKTIVSIVRQEVAHAGEGCQTCKSQNARCGVALQNCKSELKTEKVNAKAALKTAE